MRITLITQCRETNAIGEADYFMPDSGGYIRFESPGKSGTQGSQITWPKKRTTSAYSTVSATPETFETVLRQWARRNGLTVVGTRK